MEEQLHPGRVISGRFRLERQLGRGGMGTVWEARHLSLQTQIAIKFLNADLSRRHDVLARFAREATSAARINSPHVVSILDSGFTDDGRGFIAMELLRGEDLGRRLARLGTLALSETALLVAQMARGLAKAHAVGVVHRDLKPENIFVLDEDEDDAFTVKILDFGIAKSLDSAAATHKTDTGQLLGTPLYMSPEQALGRAVDSRSDLYSLAVVAYRCLTGRPPFSYEAVGELIVAVSTHVPPPPSEFNPALSAELDAWFSAALAKDPNARVCQKAAEVAESFTRACGSAAHGSFLRANTPRATAYPSRPPAGNNTEHTPLPSAEEVATTMHAAHMPFEHQRRQRRVRWPMPALLAVFGLAAASVAFQMRTPRTETKTAAAPRAVEPRVLTRTMDAALPATPEDPRPSSPGTAASAERRLAPRPAATAPHAAPSARSIPSRTTVVRSEAREVPEPTASTPIIAAPVVTAPAAVPAKKSGPTLDRDYPWQQAAAGP